MISGWSLQVTRGVDPFRRGGLYSRGMATFNCFDPEGILGLSKQQTVLLLILVSFATVAGFLIPIAVDDIRMADVYSVDEAGAAVEFRYLLREGLGVGLSHKYGSLFYYVPYALLAPFHGLSDRVILIVLRGVCAIFAIGCLALTYRLGCVSVGANAGLAGVAFLSLMVVFLRWSVTIHPDLPQLCWILLTLLSVCRLCRRFSFRDLAAAAALAALAFNTKYAGVFLLPIIGLAGFLAPSDNDDAQLTMHWRDLRRFAGLAVIAMTFVFVFALTNPHAVLDFSTFWESLSAEREIMAFGHSVQGRRSLYDWLALLYAILGPVNGIVLCLLGGYLAYAAMMGQIAVRRETVVLLLWVLVMLAYLSIFSSLKRARHLLPILPVVTLFLGYAYSRVWNRLSTHPARWSIAVVGILSVCGPASEGNAFVQGRLERRTTTHEIAAGRWIGENYSPGTRILYSTYAYVPSEFEDTFRLFEMSYPIVNHFRPDLLVVREAMAAEYADTSRAHTARTGRLAFLDAHFFHSFLKDGRIDDYALVRSFGTVHVYRRSQKISTRRGSWRALVEEYADGKLRGASGARQRVGALLLAAGDTALAREQRERGLQSEAREIRLYRDALKYLRAGRVEEAKDHFAEIMELSSGATDSFKAVVHQRIARSYFEHRYFAEAAAEAGRAIELKDRIPATHFERAMFLLASDNESAADSVLTEAIGRFGQSSHGRSLLRQLVAQDIAAEGAKRMLQAHYGREARDR